MDTSFINTYQPLYEPLKNWALQHLQTKSTYNFYIIFRDDQLIGCFIAENTSLLKTYVEGLYSIRYVEFTNFTECESCEETKSKGWVFRDLDNNQFCGFYCIGCTLKH